MPSTIRMQNNCHETHSSIC